MNSLIKFKHTFESKSKYLTNLSFTAKPKGVYIKWNDDYYASYNTWVEKMAQTPVCDSEIASPLLPANCYESAATPGELFKKLDQWGFDNIVIPHGTTWGFYTPPNADWRHQLNKDNIDPEKTRLIEVYSGHGNSEVFRDFTVRKMDITGDWTCPEPTYNYLPACWQAGEIILNRCLAEGNEAIIINNHFSDFESISDPGSTPK